MFRYVNMFNTFTNGYSNEVVLVSSFTGVHRKRINCNPEQAAIKEGQLQVAEYIREFDYEVFSIKKKSHEVSSFSVYFTMQTQRFHSLLIRQIATPNPFIDIVH